MVATDGVELGGGKKRENLCGCTWTDPSADEGTGRDVEVAKECSE